MDKNIVIDKAYVQQLKTETVAYITEGIRHAGELKKTLQSIESDVLHLPSEARDSRMSRHYINGALFGGTSGLESAIRKINSSLSDIMVNIPTDDVKWGKLVQELTTTVSQLGKLADQYRSLIGKANVSPGEFVALLNGLSNVSDALLTDLDDKLMALKGLVETAEYTIDPVNLSTGNFIYSKTDLEIVGASPLRFERFYNTMDHDKGVMGAGWHHSFDIALKEYGTGDVEITYSDGRQEIYQRKDHDGYIASKGRFSRLRKESDGFVLAEKDQRQYFFNQDGCLTCVCNANGNGINLSYEDGKLTGISNSCGTIQLHYENELVCQISDHVGREVTYRYEDGKLTEVTTPLGHNYQYVYDSFGRMAQVINAMGNPLVSNLYDEKHRVVLQLFPDGGSMQYSYDKQGQKTLLEEQNGNKITYVQDEQYRNIAVAYANGRTQTTYTDENLCAAYTDKKGNTYQYEYDAAGNRTRICDPLGQIRKISYTDLSQPISVFYPNHGKACYAYDENGNLKCITDALGRRTEINYCDNGLPSFVKFPDGSDNLFVYDDRGNMTSITNTRGGVTHYEHDALNRVIKTIDPNGNESRFEYDRDNHILQAINAAGKERHYSYNASGKLVNFIDFDGTATHYEYDSLNHIVSITDPTGGITRYEYDVMWNITKQINPEGWETQYEYNSLGEITSITDPEGNRTEYNYDPNGNIVKILNPIGFQRTFEYDALDRLISAMDEQEHQTKYRYDAMGQLTQVIDCLGHEISFAYDLAEQLIRETDAAGNATEYTYNALGRVETVRNAAGGTITYEYDRGGKVKSIRDTHGILESYSYDGVGNLLTKTDGLGHCTVYRYDCGNRIVEITDPLGHKETMEYDARGNVTKRVDPNGNAITYVYNGLGVLTSETDAAGTTTDYTYDKAGNLRQIEKSFCSGADDAKLSVEHREKQVITYTRNQNGLITEERNSLGQAQSFAYDPLGNLITKTEADGTTTRYEYDPSGNLCKITYGDGREVEMVCNPLGQLVEMQDWNGRTKIDLDPLGHPSKVVNHDGLALEYGWNCLGKREYLKYDDKETSWYYDEYGRPTGMKSEELGTTRYEYDPLGRLHRCVHPNQLVTRYTYDPLGRILMRQLFSAEDTIDQWDYGYNATGYRSSITRNGKATNYFYDAAGRLTTVQSPDGSSTKYSYDGLGNRLARESETDRTTYKYNHLNQLIASSGTDGLRRYHYDLRGNLNVVEKDGSLEKQYEFDAANRLKKAVNVLDGISEFTYDGFGNRIRTVNSNDGNNLRSPVFHYTVDPAKAHHNVLRINDENWTWGKGFLTSSALGEKAYYHLNELGTPVLTTNAIGDITNIFSTDAFGQPEDPVSIFGFTGHQFDRTSGCYYAQERYYDPSVGRFISQDPAKSGWNWYNYCGNNPINFVDLLGLDIYYYYGADQESAFKVNEKILRKQYGSDFHAIKVTDPAQFSKDWNQMGTVNGKPVEIEKVIINVHGNPESLDNINISDARGKKIDELYLFSCNAGHQDYPNNPSAQIYSNNNIGTLIGSDGTHYRSIKGINFLWWNKRVEHTTLGDDIFERWRDLADPGSTRASMGFVLYYRDEYGRIQVKGLDNRYYNVVAVIHAARAAAGKD